MKNFYFLLRAVLIYNTTIRANTTISGAELPNTSTTIPVSARNGYKSLASRSLKSRSALDMRSRGTSPTNKLIRNNCAWGIALLSRLFWSFWLILPSFYLMHSTLSEKFHFFVETVSSMIVLFYKNVKYVNVLPIERKGLLNNFPSETGNDVYINTKYVLIRNSVKLTQGFKDVFKSGQKVIRSRFRNLYGLTTTTTTIFEIFQLSWNISLSITGFKSPFNS